MKESFFFFCFKNIKFFFKVFIVLLILLIFIFYKNEIISRDYRFIRISKEEIINDIGKSSFSGMRWVYRRVNTRVNRR